MEDNPRPLRPLSIPGVAKRNSTRAVAVPAVPVRLDTDVAPNGNDSTISELLREAPLHILLVVPHLKMWEYLKDKVYVATPPYWKGKVAVHIMPEAKNSQWDNKDWTIRQALVETGLVSAEDVELAIPVELSLGWKE